MATDKERLEELLNSFGVDYTEVIFPATIQLTCEQGDAKVGGYIGFSTTFAFDLEGKFIEMGAYES